MEIVLEERGEIAELRLRGRLDAYWSDYLAREMDQVIENGGRQLLLDLAETPFISSAGIGVLIRYHKQLNRIGGRLAVIRPAEPVRRVLELTRLDEILCLKESELAEWQAREVGQELIHKGAVLRVFEDAPEARLTCRVEGDPGRLAIAGYRAEHLRTQAFPADHFGLGLGAIGTNPMEAATSLGEFLAAGGAVVHLPTHGTHTPDYLLAAESLVPEIQVGYALVGQGNFAYRAHFEIDPGDPSLTLGDLIEAFLPKVNSGAMGLLFTAETASLVGAALQQAPQEALAWGDRFTLPQLRESFSFTVERAFARTVALVVGVVVRGPAGELTPFLRPLGQNHADWLGHFHAAVFSYRPLPKKEAKLAAAVHHLFVNHSLEAVTHLLVDDRELIGLGDSAFLRGTAWFGPLTWSEATQLP